MKTLYLVRHAKSSWKNPALGDRDRPLNARGKRDAPVMAEYVKQKIEKPDIFVSSPSRRTQDTAVLFMNAFGRSMEQLILEESFYHGYENDMESVISHLDPTHHSAMLFVHNPGITDYVNQLTGEQIFNIPTCGIAAVQLETKNWAEINQCQAKLLFYYYPKGLDLQ
ncbi:MAG: histidine phosphatase family protein [Reichenbachiella sp.]|uniref:SixA phosphatase family protein n=1 Tax=Reichenbachiella sp. TaxID=2184521 RepID=UPI00326730A8